MTASDKKATTSGLHHVTGITANVPANLDFYVGFLGLKLVKRTAGYADAEQLHLIYGDGLGSPGSLLTFLVWEATGRGRTGIGQVSEVALAVSPLSIGDWLTKSLAANIPVMGPSREFGEPVLRLKDPDGMIIKLVGVDMPTLPPCTDAPTRLRGVMRRAILLRGMSTTENAVRGDLSGTHILMLGGRYDVLVRRTSAQVEDFRARGATVEVRTLSTGHELTNADVRQRNGFCRTFLVQRLFNSLIRRFEGKHRRACTMDTIIWQRFEGAGVCAAALILFVFLGDGMVWWLAILLFFAPDISFAGYLAGPRIGAFAYNLVHLYAFGTSFLAFGVGLETPVLAGLGALWVAHAGFDRMLGYGLKSPDGFTVTHLGPIGR